MNHTGKKQNTENVPLILIEEIIKDTELQMKDKKDRYKRSTPNCYQTAKTRSRRISAEFNREILHDQ